MGIIQDGQVLKSAEMLTVAEYFCTEPAPELHSMHFL